jgi:hypothetical protein
LHPPSGQKRISEFVILFISDAIGEIEGLEESFLAYEGRGICDRSVVSQDRIREICISYAPAQKLILIYILVSKL